MGLVTLEHSGVSVEVTQRWARPQTYRSAHRVPPQVRLIVLHSAECGEVPTAAEALASWAAGEQGPVGASWHFAVDSDSITQSVPEEAIAWHAGRVNADSIGIEQAGRASQSAAQWDDAYSRSMLANVAELLAYLSQRWEIPLVALTDDELRNGARGITTHGQITRAYSVRGGHTDPGPSYPLARVLANALEMGGRES
jgi:N-acetyl-anhydromuramyl-L-alanine amidase AmpD